MHAWKLNYLLGPQISGKWESIKLVYITKVNLNYGKARKAKDTLDNRRGSGGLNKRVGPWGCRIFQKFTTQGVCLIRGVIDDVYCSDLVLCCI